jgi:hypothetical protein
VEIPKNLRAGRTAIGLFGFHKSLKLNGLQRISGFFNGEKMACFLDGSRDSRNVRSVRNGESRKISADLLPIKPGNIDSK